MVTCTSCGQPLEDDARFCENCGRSREMGAVAGASGKPTAKSLLLERLRAASTGRFEVRGEIGRGGMAAVFLAYDLRLNRRVALKVMLPGLAFTEGMSERFQQEARTAANLDHPNIVTIYSVEELEDLLFFVMKYVEGRSLDRVLKDVGALPVEVAQFILIETADALEYAHSEGVVHRDVKPGNVLLDRRGQPVVTDFGIAKAAEAPSLTVPGSIVGTPAYMSPEQFRGKPAIPASDQYALGIMAYEMLTGEPPFTGTMVELQTAHISERPKPLIEVRPEVKPALNAAVMRMLDKAPEARWPTLAAAAEALRKAATLDENEARSRLVEIGLLASSSSSFGLLATPISPLVRGKSSGGGAAAPPAEPQKGEGGGGGGPRTPVRSTPPAPVRPPRPADPAGDERTIVEPKEQAVGQVTPPPVAPPSPPHPPPARTEPPPKVRTAKPTPEAEPTIVEPAKAPPERERQRPTPKPSSVPAVQRAAAGTIKIAGVPSTIRPGDSFKLRATVFGSDGSVLANPALAWSSDEPTLARVDAQGLVSAVAPGIATLTARCDEASTSIILQISKKALDRITIVPPSGPLSVGKGVFITANVFDGEGRQIDARVDWLSRAPKIAAIADDGHVAPLQSGEVEIVASYQGIETSLRLQIIDVRKATPPAGSSPFVTPAGARLPTPAVPAGAAAGAVRTPSKPPATPDSAAPDAESRERARRKRTQLLMAVGSAAAIILITAVVIANRRDTRGAVRVDPGKGGNTTRSESVSVIRTDSTKIPSDSVVDSTSKNPPPPSAAVPATIAIAASPRILVSQSVRLRAVVDDSSGAPMPRAAVEWRSSNPAVASIDPRTGVVTAKASGRFDVTARAGSVVAQAQLVVETPRITSVDIRNLKSPLTVGETTAPVAAVATELGDLDEQALARIGVDQRWASSSPEVARIDARTGEVTAVGRGSTTISLSAGTLTTRRTLEVTATTSPPNDNKYDPPPRPPKPTSKTPAEIERNAADAIRTYGRAIEALDMGALRSIYPTISRDDQKIWEGFIRDAKDVSFVIQSATLQSSISDAEGSEAVFAVRRSMTFYSKSGRRQQGPIVGQDRVTVVKTGASWHIKRIE